jgi:hypothetical protein
MTISLEKEDRMSDDKSKVGRQDRDRIALSQPYEVDDFHQKHKRLSRDEAVRIIKETKGNRLQADQIAEAPLLKRYPSAK